MMTTSRSVLLVGWLLALGLLLSGCDAGGGETATFTLEPVTFDFPEFDQSDLSPGGQITLTSTQTIDLASRLQANGFQKSEVVSAEVSEVVLIRQSLGTLALPKRTKVFDFLTEATAQLTASNLPPVTIATKTGEFTQAGEIPLNVVSEGVTNYVQAPRIGARVLFDVGDNFGEGPYRVQIKVTFRVTAQL